MFVFIKYIALYAIYATAWVIILLSLTGKVRYGLFFLIPLIPLQNIIMKMHQLPMGKDLNDIIIIAMLIGWFISKSSTGKPPAGKTSYNKIIFLYFLFTYFALWHGSFYLGIGAPLSALDPRVQTWKNYMILPLLFLLTMNNIENTKEMKRLFIFICLGMFLMNYYTMQQVSSSTAWWSRIKIKGTFEWLGANEIAAFYATYTFVLIGLFLFIKDIRWRIALGILIFQNIFCDLFLFSRGAYLATLAGLSLIGILREKKLLVIVAIILIFWQTLLPKDVVLRIEATETGAGQLDASAAMRLTYWQQSIEYFKSSPIIGIGFNTITSLGVRRDTHNLYLRTLAEEGIIGLGFLLLIMGLAIKRGLLLFRKANDNFLKGLGLGFAACAVAVMVGNMFGDRWTYMPVGAYFWVFLGMVERGNLIVASSDKPSEHVKQKVSYKEKIDRVYSK